jgi:uncharacterized protein (DUF488 family)
MSAMVKRGFLKQDDTSFEKADNIDYLDQLKFSDLTLLQEVKEKYGKLSAKALMKHTYINYPFYATRSEVAENILNKEEFAKVIKAKPGGINTVLFTIGYEGISLEEYLVRLIKNDVKLLVDVRNNPLSMKYGFSKSQLKKYCESIGILYVHFPEVGIKSEQRRELNSQADYDQLFSVYRKNNLSKTTETQTEIIHLLKQHKRIALTCFEANICQCHRKHLSEAIKDLSVFDFEVKHI